MKNMKKFRFETTALAHWRFELAITFKLCRNRAKVLPKYHGTPTIGKLLEPSARVLCGVYTLDLTGTQTLGLTQIRTV